MKTNPTSVVLAAIFSSLIAMNAVAAKTSLEKFPVPKKGGTFNDTLMITPMTLNPMLATNIDDMTLTAYFYMPLMERDLETYEDIPGLAQKVEMSKDKKEYTFTLDPKAKWSDGMAVTSDDVEFTFNKMMDPKVEAAAARSFMSGVTFQKIDALKFKFMVAVPKYNSLSTLTTFTPIQKKQFEKESDFNKSRENLHPIGSGPYKLKSISRDQMVVLERDQNWWAKDIAFHRPTHNYDLIQLKIIADPALRYENFLKGNIDTLNLSADQFVTQVQGVDKDKFARKANSGKELWADQFPSKGSLPWFGVGINQKHAFLNSLKTRQALAYLMDYEVITERAFLKTVIQSVSPFGSQSDNTPADLKSGSKKYKYDVKKAIVLLKEDGWDDADHDGIIEKTINGKITPFRVEYKTYSGSQPGMKTAQIMKESMKKAGIELQIRAMDGTALYKDFDDKNFDMVFMGWGGGSIYPDPKQIWATESIENGSNKVGYSSAKVDQLIAKANLEFDKKKRAKMLQEISQELYRDLPYIFLVERAFVLQAMNAKIKSPVWIQKYSTGMSKELFHQ